MIEGCTDDFAHANLSWVTADQAYLARVTPSPETINDLKAYEFFAGHDSSGQPVWTRDFEKIKPLVEWNNHMGCVTATYVPGLKKYLMCVTDGWPTVAKMTSYILEADKITGPWRMVSYMKNFGEQAYFLNFPSKFISPDGRNLWLAGLDGQRASLMQVLETHGALAEYNRLQALRQSAQEKLAEVRRRIQQLKELEEGRSQGPVGKNCRGSRLSSRTRHIPGRPASPMHGG